MAEDGTATSAQIEQALADMVKATGAHIGALYLTVSADQLLRMVRVIGVSLRVARPWSMVALAAPVPVAEAAREGHPIWLSSHVELARRYPRTALALPYDVAMSVVPLITGNTCRGALLQLWPGTRDAGFSPQKEQATHEGARRINGLLRQAADEGNPLPPEELRTVDPPPARYEEPGLEITERLPEGLCALDLEGRVRFNNRMATELLGVEERDLLGARLWEALPWLLDPVYENSYLAALFSRLPRSFTALRPPDRLLSFYLYPDATGVSVRIMPARESAVPPEGPAVTAGEPTVSLEGPAMPTLANESGDDPVAASNVTEQTRPGALYQLLHLSSALTESVGVKDVTEAVTNQILPVIDAQSLAMVVVDGGRLQVIGSRGFSQEIVDGLQGLSLSADAPEVRAIMTGIPTFHSHVEELRRIYPDIKLSPGTAACAHLPMFASGRTIGSVLLGYSRPHSFPPDERAGLTSLAGVIAQALERARLYDTKNQVALGLQAALLPGALPEVPGIEVAARYIPATSGMDIGGDFYDLIRLDDTSVAAVIGDVQGHNVNAAALMGQVRTAVHTHASAGTPPGEILARTNRLLADLSSNLFTSVLYAHLDLKNHWAHLATAGHLPPVLLHPDGRTEIIDRPFGILLGIEPEAEYRTFDVPLAPGATLALYTDGLVEVPGTDLGDSIAEFAAHLAEADSQPLEELTETLVRRAAHARRHSWGSDDVALLLIKLLAA
ncbi:SpoIIE family protein phosphatase [Streptomyces sp. NPDC051217]|uniref:PP2C family protein-serine/threonine phosphatase n=1 Tax=Streptomyces sp. NPDC051217 TaxID=3365644 RepID=UPI003791855D